MKNVVDEVDGDVLLSYAERVKQHKNRIDQCREDIKCNQVAIDGAQVEINEKSLYIERKRRDTAKIESDIEFHENQIRGLLDNFIDICVEDSSKNNARRSR